jgi:hypothetical protein
MAANRRTRFAGCWRDGGNSSSHDHSSERGGVRCGSGGSQHGNRNSQHSDWSSQHGNWSNQHGDDGSDEFACG